MKTYLHLQASGLGLAVCSSNGTFEIQSYLVVTTRKGRYLYFLELLYITLWTS